MTDYATDIRKYTASIDDRAVAAIVAHLGIALKSKDASIVSCSSKAELERVRESWLKRTLGLTDPDADLDKALKELCARLAGEKSKHRVTFYYLLAEKFGKLVALAK